MKLEFTTHSEQETLELGKKLSSQLKPNMILAFYGDLAAGKTAFIKGVVKGVGGIEETEVSSPTFTYLNIYEGNQTLYHFDLYRIEQSNTFLKLGFDEFYDVGGVCCIEWAEKIRPLLPQKRIDIQIEHHEDGRKITIESHHDQIQL